MKKTWVAIIFCSLVLSVLIGKYFEGTDPLPSDFNDDRNKEVVIFSSFQEFSIDSGVDFMENEMDVIPPLPAGTRIFQRQIDIIGDPIDSMGDSVCIITGDLGSLCWQGDEGEYQVERRSSKHVEGLPEGGFVSIATGQNHTCAMHDSLIGISLVCWGSNWYGQTGGSSQTSTNWNVLQAENGNWTSLDAGRIHTCGVSGGDVFCWGDGSRGQIGDGFSSQSSTPIEIEIGAEEIVKVISGSFHNCALTGLGDVFCWGWNGFGQIGDGSFDDAFVPREVIFPNGEIIEDIEVGESHNCAKARSGSIFCWGNNLENQISPNRNYSSSIPVKTFQNVARDEVISLGASSSCVIFSHDYECLGEFRDHQIPDLSRITSFSSGSGFFCYILHGENVNCRGTNVDFVPREALTISPPTSVWPGLISGVVLTEESSNHRIMRVNESVPLANISFVVQLGSDTDFDGWSDLEEEECDSNSAERLSKPIDTDKDGVCNHIDNDDDNDGFSDDDDSFPLDVNEWKDNDKDGIGSNSDSFEVTTPVVGAIITGSILLIIFLLEAREIFQLSRTFNHEEEE